MPARTPKRKPKGKAKQKAPPKPVVVDPDIQRFPTIASMHAVKVKYSDPAVSAGVGQLDSFPRQGEKLTEDRKARAANIDNSEQREEAVIVEEQRLQSKVTQTNMLHLLRHALGVATYVKVNLKDDVHNYPILPDPTKALSSAIPQPLPPLHGQARK